MRKLLFCIALAAIASLCLAPTANAQTVSNVSFVANTGSVVDQTSGFMGMLLWQCDNTSPFPVSYYIAYEIDVYVPGTGWTEYMTGYNSVASNAGTTYNEVQFYADVVTGIPAGCMYNVATWICTYNEDGTVADILASTGDTDTDYSGFVCYVPIKLPPPALWPPYPSPPLYIAPPPVRGKIPKIIYPVLPPSGPSGPGSFYTSPNDTDFPVAASPTPVTPAEPGTVLLASLPVGGVP